MRLLGKDGEGLNNEMTTYACHGKMLYHHFYAVVYYHKLLTPLLRRSAFNEEGGCIGGWVGA
jgi:hypothetical protein